jgi:hypothetical protein
LRSPGTRLLGFYYENEQLGYFFKFLLFPSLVLAAMLLAFRSSIPPRPVIWAIVYGAGLVSWTLIEYLIFVNEYAT